MIDKLEKIHERYIEVEDLISDPEVMEDMKRYVKLSKEYKDLEPIILAYKEYKLLVDNIYEAKILIKESNDSEMKEMAKLELDSLLPRKDEMDEMIKVLLIPKDPADEKNAVMEIRAGTGGDEAGLLVCKDRIDWINLLNRVINNPDEFKHFRDNATSYSKINLSWDQYHKLLLNHIP